MQRTRAWWPYGVTSGVVVFAALIGSALVAQNTLGAGFLPHGYCFTWIPGLLWLHVVSDSSIALAYLTIPITLFYVVKRRIDLPFGWMFLLFGSFIIACGTTHALDVWTIWNADYWLAGAVKALTAAVSVSTAIALIWLVPRALAMPSAEQMRQANEALVQEIETRVRITHSAHHDFLTGLPNRLLLNDRLDQAIASSKRNETAVAVMYLDLDGFKHINDSLGHPIGDGILRSVGQRLAECVRGVDTVSRQGGDEFVVLLTGLNSAEDAAVTACRMLQAVGRVHSIEGHDLHVTTSIGISVYPDDAVDAHTLIRYADSAMYQAKANCPNSYRFFATARNVEPAGPRSTRNARGDAGAAGSERFG